jgi:hypothetical protein
MVRDMLLLRMEGLEKVEGKRRALKRPDVDEQSSNRNDPYDGIVGTLRHGEEHNADADKHSEDPLKSKIRCSDRGYLPL